MRGYGQYCPIALGAEVFAERWTPIILRNVFVGCHRFGEILEGAPGLSRSVLVQRLRRLERDGVVQRERRGRAVEYHLTDCGMELIEVCTALGVWGARWREVPPEYLDPYLALWMLSRLIDPATLPRRRIVVRFDLTDGSRPDRYWLLLARNGNEVCAQPPGFDDDGIVTVDT
ncbi:helix-turn-helix domain-containing protein, partial [Nonomuraea fuscirosea]